MLGSLLAAGMAIIPKLFWPALIVFTVGTAGLMIRGYTVIDEFLLACIIAGILYAIIARKQIIKRKPQGKLNYAHQVFFLLLMGYLVFESLRGIVVMESLQKFRWVFFFGLLGITAFLVTKDGLHVPGSRRMYAIVASTTLAYLAVYILSGFVSENIFQFSRWDLQTTYWATTAYALFPLVIGVPSALFLVRDKRNSYKFLGWGTIAASLIAVTYYESRVGLIILAVFIITLIFSSGFGRGLLILFSLLIIIACLFGILYGQELEEKALYYYEDVSKTLVGLYNWDVSSSDIDRKVHMEAGFLSIKENATNLLFGYGFRTSGTVISPYLKKLFEDRGFPGLAAVVRDDESTEGYTAMLVDTGLAGMLLLIINFVLTCCQIVLSKGNPNRLALLLSALLALLWLPVINMLDITLFYFLIMPSGLLVQLSRYSPASTKSINHGAAVTGGTRDLSLNVSEGSG